MRRFASRLVLLLSMLSSGPSVFAEEFDVLPVQKVEISSDDIQVTYSIPCGNHFAGFVIRWDNSESIRVGVLTEVGEVLCAGFPQVTMKSITKLATGKVKSVRSIESSDVRDRFRLITPGDIRQVASRQVQLVYESRCGHFDGFAYKEGEKGRIEVAIVERIPHNSLESTCNYKQEVIAMGSLRSVASKDIQPISYARVNLKKAFELSFAPIRGGSLKTDSVNGLQFDYERNCRQAPIGVVMSSPKGTSERQAVVVGMVVAEFFNTDCDTKAEPIRETFKDARIHIPAKFLVELYSGDVVEDFVLKQPTQYDTDRPESASFDFIPGCGKAWGAVYSKDQNGDLAVGVLESVEPGICKSPAKEATLSQPYLTQSGLRAVIFPMKIRGLQNLTH